MDDEVCAELMFMQVTFCRFPILPRDWVLQRMAHIFKTGTAQGNH